MKKKTGKAKKNLIKAFSNSSFRFLSDFLNDSGEKRAQAQANETIINQLNTAALQNSLVVLQVQSEKDPEKFETVSGWLPKSVGKDSLVIRTQEDQLQMLKIEAIKKVTTLSPKGDQERVSR
ncbi:hypothetical protein NRIC_36750 [Enterococcus florum]|uniref:Uncharacterized protein n=1 Tax=Enterococcus florum TaxID=2480627 RepID=A0A4P5PG80_9ENTE|nr:hypothetical protein [Enterococcus florum]GCF95784.1 hypothetical protein NRIC_36750 [Enterococcus florum]